MVVALGLRRGGPARRSARGGPAQTGPNAPKRPQDAPRPGGGVSKPIEILEKQSGSLSLTIAASLPAGAPPSSHDRARVLSIGRITSWEGMRPVTPQGGTRKRRRVTLERGHAVEGVLAPRRSGNDGWVMPPGPVGGQTGTRGRPAVRAVSSPGTEAQRDCLASDGCVAPPPPETRRHMPHFHRTGGMVRSDCADGCTPSVPEGCFSTLPRVGAPGTAMPFRPGSSGRNALRH